MRYADDFSMYVKSKKSAKRVGNSIYTLLRDKLQWPINWDKSGIRRPPTFEIVGYSVVPIYKKGTQGTYQFVVKKSKWKEFKVTLKQRTKKTIPMSFDERIQWINWWIRG